VNNFAENTVTKVDCYTPYRSVSGVGAHLPSLGRSACRWIGLYDGSCDTRLVQSQTYRYLPTFPVDNTLIVP